MDKRQSDAAGVGDFERMPTRTFERDGKWYYASREGEFGPFDSEAK